MIRWLAAAALSLAASLACAGTATLSWTPPTEYTDGAPLEVAGYRLFERCGADAYGAPIAVPAPASTYTRTGLPDGTTCWWQLTALDALGVESERSVEVFKTFPAAGEPPGAPGALVVTWLGQAEPPAEPPDMALTLFSRCEGATLDGTHDYSAGDTTWTLVSAAEFSTSGVKVGTNGLHLPSSDDSATLDAASIVNRLQGCVAFWMRYSAWGVGERIVHLQGTAAADHILISTGATGEIGLRHRVNGGNNILLQTTAAGMTSGNWYFVQAKWHGANDDLRLEVYDSSGSLIQAVENLSASLGGSPADIITIRFGTTEGTAYRGSLDNLFIGNDYADDFLASRDITSYTSYGGGPVTLTVQDAGHSHSVDNVALTQAGTLTVADALHAHAVDSPALTQAHILAVADALHSHAVDAVALSQANTLSVADAVHAHTVDGMVLTVGHVLAVQDAAHAHTVDSVALVQSHILAVADALHAHAADNVSLSAAGTLTIADAVHAHSVDSVQLTQANVLVVQSTDHGHAVDNVVLSESQILAVADALHAHAVDAIALTQAHVLAVQDAAHGHVVDALALTQAAVLVVDDTLHAHLVDAVTLRLPGSLGAATLFVVQAADRVLVVAPSQRYFTVH